MIAHLNVLLLECLVFGKNIEFFLILTVRVSSKEPPLLNIEEKF